VGCKSGQAMNGMLREKCREKKIPLLLLDYDLLDPRIVSQESMMSQVEFFMENVMKARRIDTEEQQGGSWKPRRHAGRVSTGTHSEKTGRFTGADI
jgi:hypothetical protein